MPAYLIVDIHIKDTEGFEEYRKLVPATLEKYGGKYLVRGGAFEVLEGEWHPKRMVVLEFPSADHARRWYHSAEYREPKSLRIATTSSNVVLVEGTA